MMQSLGLIPVPSTAAATVKAPPGAGKGASVAILGGGIAGLVAAYELRKLGYRCTVLEARSRPGGRNWTVRPGDKIGLNGMEDQACVWDQGNYQNFGPARLPSIHRTMLGYCRELGVELEVEVNSSRSTFLQDDKVAGGKPIVQRQAINDTRGHVAELLAKCAKQGALDQAMTKEDRDRIFDFLRVYGPLDPSGSYQGSDRAGYAKQPGAGDETGTISTPLELHVLLDPAFWAGELFEESFIFQPTMFQPKGGMDRIPYAFARELGDVVKYQAPVSAIRKTAKGVRVSFVQQGVEETIEADYCFCALPLTILRSIPNDFSRSYRKVIEETEYNGAYKIAWESRRFWEQDYNIYGGLSFLAQGCSPVWYPSANLFSPRGVVVAGYTIETGTPFETLTLPQKLAASRAAIERLHSGHGKELEKPLYVGWAKVPYNLGSWRAHERDGAGANPGYELLLQPDGPVYFIGDHVSHIVAWQEGAALSAHRAIKLLNERVAATAKA